MKVRRYDTARSMYKDRRFRRSRLPRTDGRSLTDLVGFVRFGFQTSKDQRKGIEGPKMLTIEQIRETAVRTGGSTESLGGFGADPRGEIGSR